MKCPYCKHKFDQSFELCPYCKANLKNIDFKLDPKEDRVLLAIKNKLFLIICILTSASCVIPLIKSGFDIFSLLYSIFLWSVYLGAKNNFVSKKRLKAISGTIYAEYIVGCIAGIGTFLSGLLIAFFISVIAQENSSIINELTASIGIGVFNTTFIQNILIKLPGVFFASLFVLLSVVTLLPNLIWRTRIHYFAKSVYKSLSDQYVQIEYAREAKNSLLILGSISLVLRIFLYSNIFVLLGDLCQVGACVLAAIIIDKYFIKDNSN